MYDQGFIQITLSIQYKVKRGTRVGTISRGTLCQGVYSGSRSPTTYSTDLGSSSAGVQKSSAGVSPVYTEYIPLFTPDKLYIYTELYFSPSINFLYILSIYRRAERSRRSLRTI